MGTLSKKTINLLEVRSLVDGEAGRPAGMQAGRRVETKTDAVSKNVRHTGRSTHKQAGRHASGEHSKRRQTVGDKRQADSPTGRHAVRQADRQADERGAGTDGHARKSPW
jgi:hypothetical protein